MTIRDQAHWRAAMPRLSSLAAMAIAVVSAVTLAPIPARCEEFPSRMIKIIVPQAPGGLVDILPRILGGEITKSTRQPVVVENRLGGNGAVAGAEVAAAAPDGYTLMMSFHALQAMLPHMTDSLRFDPNKDLVPVVHILTVPNILLVHPSLPATSLMELIALAKANPAKLAFASQGVGSTGQIGGELFKRLAGIDIVHVPHRGAAPAQNALLGGHIQMMFDILPLSVEAIKEGRVRAIGITANQRVPVLAAVPTLAEGGLRLEMSAWFGLMAPRGTPDTVIAWLNREANRVFSTPDIRDRFVAQGADLPLGTPDAFRSHITAEFEKWGPVIRHAGIRLN